MLQWVTLAFEESEPQVFVQFWKQAYRADASTYDQNIRRGSLLDSNNVERLMHWKAGRQFQASATAFARAVPLAVLNSRRNHNDTLTDTKVRELYDEITNVLRRVGLQRTRNIIWRIFLCHVAHPQDTPIYDVNVWIAWRFITGQIESQHYHQRPVNFDIYLKFRAWHNKQVVDYGLDQQELDQALMAFGQFLRSRWGRLVR